ncbi:hypothetical protein ABH940_000837 [Streptacidiphilus sp. BW17]|uniref:hypothetical protein n=1 Tax=Streptacidiphilus sp. BW17 TaxID=3156274 RepID=UPI003512EAF5
MNLEELAAEMLRLMPSFIRPWRGNRHDYALTVWICRLYGYDVRVRQDDPNNGKIWLDADFTRIDEPSARRRAEWMRNPAGDPSYPPPVAWHVNGGFGFHPPGWHPAARLVITPEVERSLVYNEEAYRQQLHNQVGGWSRPTRRPDPDLPPAPPPPPPPSTIAYPDDERQR